ncbi:sulfatase-like hydrolase/transferase [Serratia ureilytica]|uniref:sulfatase-like hydrolase/transferase n=1 Tax=Serratia ureilytica TaxID=300181 RepID=UPI00370FC613
MGHLWCWGGENITFRSGGQYQCATTTNGKYEQFYRSKDLSCYIQSIKNTDTLLQQITSIATANEAKWSLLYFADHGLGQFNKGMDDVYMEHDDLNQQAFMPPFVITSYDDTRRVRVTEPRTGFDFVAIFAQWLRIRDANITERCDFLSNTACGERIEVLDKDFKRVDIDTLGADDTAV